MINDAKSSQTPFVYALIIGCTWLAENANAAGGFTNIQGNSGSAYSGNTVSVVLPANPTTGNLVLCGVNYWNDPLGTTTISSAKDASNLLYNHAKSPTVYNTGAGQTFLFYLLNAPGTANKTITVTFAARNCEFGYGVMKICYVRRHRDVRQ